MLDEVFNVSVEYVWHKETDLSTYDCIILAMKHTQFESMGASFIRSLCKSAHIIYDLKYTLKADESDLRL